jgi:stearoyl-CoA desaturase (delta-9 desaturase)
MPKLKEKTQEYVAPTPKKRWVGTWYFIFIHVVGLIGTPIYIHYYGWNAADWILFGIYFGLSSMAITVGYHRLFSHVSFKTSPFMEIFWLYFASSTMEESALKWSSQHRQHHLHTDTDLDPYNINKGFFYAHVGWIINWKHKVNYSNVQDLSKRPWIFHQHRYYGGWSVISGMIVPLAIGFAIGRPLGAFVLSICLRLVCVMNSAFFINSFAHTFGKQTYDVNNSARDNLLGAILTNGEGYHSFHHRFPGDYRNGIKWYHWDPSKWCIAVMSTFRIAWDLRKATDEMIDKALEQAQKNKLSSEVTAKSK